MRHNTIRNIEAKLMENVAKDVQIEPKLLPIEGSEIAGIVGDQSRLDISARGIWGQQRRPSSMSALLIQMLTHISINPWLLYIRKMKKRIEIKCKGAKHRKGLNNRRNGPRI